MASHDLERVVARRNLDEEDEELRVESTKYAREWLLMKRLFALNRDVDSYNEKKLSELTGPAMEYVCSDSGGSVGRVE